MKQEDDITIEGTSDGDILISKAAGGSFKGEYISGEVLPVGVSFTRTINAGINRVYAPVLLESDDGKRLLMHIEAYLNIDPKKERLILSGETVSPDDYYYEGTVRFNTGEQKYKWLENQVFTCSGIIDNWETIRFEIFSL